MKKTICLFAFLISYMLTVAMATSKGDSLVVSINLSISVAESGQFRFERKVDMPMIMTIAFLDSSRCLIKQTIFDYYRSFDQVYSFKEKPHFIVLKLKRKTIFEFQIKEYMCKNKLYLNARMFYNEDDLRQYMSTQILKGEYLTYCINEICYFYKFSLLQQRIIINRFFRKLH